MAGAREVEQRPASGVVLIAIVGIAIAFLLSMALLSVAGSGNTLSETNLLFAALIFYAGAGALYLGFGVTGAEASFRFATGTTWLGLIANTAAVAHRWYEAGHPPFSSVYEMLLSFVWMLAVLTLVAQKKYGVKVIGTVTMPVAIVGMVLMQLLRSEVHPLMPLLQSTWLHVHVTLAILAYAACALSFAVALMFLVKDKMKTETFLVWTSASTSSVYVSILVARLKLWTQASSWTLNPAREADALAHKEVSFAAAALNSGLLLSLTLMAVATPLVFYALARWKKSDSLLRAADRAVFGSILMQLTTLALILVCARNGHYPSVLGDGFFPAILTTRAFLLPCMVGSVLISLLYLLLVWRREDLERLLPSSEILDRITYRTICLAFPLLTLMIATGAYWANQTWGSYWSWDPKETWAAITWLVYALYLHMRITGGWRGRRAAYFAIAGFAVVIFTFFGVTYLLPGLHVFG